MTDLDTLEAGPLLDRLVQERVFHGKVEHRWLKASEGEERQTCTWCGGQNDARLVGTNGCGMIPPYSTDMAAAWEVIKALKDRCNTCTVAYEYHQGRSEPYCGVHFHVGKHGKIGRSSASTGPLAICRAALKAMEIEK